MKVNPTLLYLVYKEKITKLKHEAHKKNVFKAKVGRSIVFDKKRNSSKIRKFTSKVFKKIRKKFLNRSKRELLRAKINNKITEKSEKFKIKSRLKQFKFYNSNVESRLEKLKFNLKKLKYVKIKLKSKKIRLEDVKVNKNTSQYEFLTKTKKKFKRRLKSKNSKLINFKPQKIKLIKKKFTPKNLKIKKILKKKNNAIKSILKYRKRKNVFTFFKNDVLLFIRKLFNSFLKKGKKYLVINYFLKTFFFVCLKILKNKTKNKTKLMFLYFYKILQNIIPVFMYTNLMFRGESLILPWIRKNAKINRYKIVKICVSWIKKSIVKRKEKTLFFKIISELEDIRKNKGESISNKHSYYLNFYQKKNYIKFLERNSWV